MSKPIYTKNYRRNLELYWQQFYSLYKIPVGYHVHHIKPKSVFENKDDLAVHHPRNLIALHPDDHWAIHRCRGDVQIKGWIFSIAGRKGIKTGPHSEERKQNISKAKKGKVANRNGYTHSAETRMKLSKSKTGVKITPMSAIGRQNISSSKQGNKNPAYGKRWYSNPDNMHESKLFIPGTEPKGWTKGMTSISKFAQ